MATGLTLYGVLQDRRHFAVTRCQNVPGTPATGDKHSGEIRIQWIRVFVFCFLFFLKLVSLAVLSFLVWKNARYFKYII